MWVPWEAVAFTLQQKDLKSSVDFFVPRRLSKVEVSGRLFWRVAFEDFAPVEVILRERVGQLVLSRLDLEIVNVGLLIRGQRKHHDL